MNYTGLVPTYHDWYVDSATTGHVTGDRTTLSNVAPSTFVGNVVTASGDFLNVAGLGTLSFDSNKAVPKVLYVSGITRNLISIGRLTDVGNMVIFYLKHCWIYNRARPSQWAL